VQNGDKERHTLQKSHKQLKASYWLLETACKMMEKNALVFEKMVLPTLAN